MNRPGVFGGCALILCLQGCGGPLAEAQEPLTAEVAHEPSGEASRSRQAVQFTFAWPDNATAQVQMQSSKKRDDGMLDRTIGARFRLRVTRTGEEIFLEVSDFTVTGVAGRLHPSGGELISAEGLMASATVGADGQNFTVTDTAGLHEAFLSLQAATLPKGVKASQDTQKLFELASEEQSLRTVAENTWLLLVGELHGTTLPLFEELVSNSNAKVPLPGQPLVELTNTLKVEPSSACAEPAAEQCVLLSYSNQPASPEKVSQFVRETLKQTLGKDFEATVQLKQTTERVLAAESLLPHQITLIKRQKFDLREAGGELKHGGQTETRTFSFDWHVNP